MEAAATASYDVLNESYTRFEETDTSDDSTETHEDAQKPIPPKKWRNIFKRKNILRKYSHDEVATAPAGYWDISSEQFERALNLKPQFKFASSAKQDEVGDQHFDTETLQMDESPLPDKVNNNSRNLESSYKKVRFAMLKQLKSLINMKSTDVDIKIIIVGDKSVGKSAVIQRFAHGTFDNDEIVESTGYDTKLMKFQNNKQYCLHLFEISGHISNAIVSPTCVSETIGAMIVFDINDTQSFESIERWKNALDAKGKQTKNGQICCILLANKCDSPDVTFNMCELDHFCAEQGILAWFDTSAKNDFNIKNAFVYLMRNIIMEQRGLKSSELMVDENRNKKRCNISSVKISFRRRNHLYDEESTTML